MYNKWGGSVVQVDGTVSDDDIRSNADMDRASVKSLEETQQSWLLGAGEPKKKKGIDLGCMIISRRACCVLVCLFVFCGFVAGLTVLLVKTLPKKDNHGPVADNYTQALHLALRFFNAQKSGKLPKSNNISWRGDSGLKDGQGQIIGPGQKRDLSGGYYDAGDNIKFTYPTAYTLTVLSWSVIEYRAKYQAIKEYDHVRELIKWGTDYLFKTFNYTVNTTDVEYIFAQVGTGGSNGTAQQPNDHYCWERPETMDYPRPAYAVDRGSDLGAEMAAAMAAASIVFRDDQAYSEKLVAASRNLLKFAEDNGKRGRYVKSLPDQAALYNTSAYYDDFLWAGSWVYFATGNWTYLTRVTNAELARNAGADGGGPFYGVFSWDSKLLGAQLLMTRLRLMHTPPYPYEDLLKQYNNQTNYVMCSYLPMYKKFKRTPGGLTLFNNGKPAPLQYTANAAFLAALYADYMTTADIPGWPCDTRWIESEALRNFSRSQIDYILGNNPARMSYVVGFGTRYPTQVHHRAASIPLDKNKYTCKGGYKFRDSKSPNKYVINGAMVGGPNKNDKFYDLRNNYTYTEPTISGNAGLVGALVALSEAIPDSGVDRNSLFTNLPPMYIPSPPPPAPYFP
ncbi:endoglucanase [Marchantia polymorpha subsp. ruderalis]|uniref:Endoglucanase n=2 Tax=Marchantia polymorpha TaxID=3197 RepID=A0A176W4R4_MARPO|nr:hypothetical protein AXG93_3911s1370 [Marchantia polymorpha subsp. ruderalis]PTQ36769.1 hypothetical protein MARPO_0061s0043 [Marchantia polymorpha]BBM99915.1 hypothetical protein Mp_1g24780 [Marchantia polymorpha subsp. ruderalis]|eukprot:PTQ36769.1 hypothetical protein MARPO_0061s0043 [Marchantia polymorpha]